MEDREFLGPRGSRKGVSRMPAPSVAVEIRTSRLRSSVAVEFLARVNSWLGPQASEPSQALHRNQADRDTPLAWDGNRP